MAKKFQTIKMSREQARHDTVETHQSDSKDQGVDQQAKSLTDRQPMFSNPTSSIPVLPV